MHRKVLDTIRRHKLLTDGDRVLVAVSGGPDSVALLAALHKLRQRLGIELAVAHLNHGLRGDDADQDERFVQGLAKRRRLPFRSHKADVAARKRSGGGSLEEVARTARYAFLRRAAKDLDANVIAVGHTADDNAETLLMNLLRGAGLRGLAAIPISRPEGDLRLVRPLLEVTRTEVLDFLHRQGLNFRTDETNADTTLTRNRIRAELLPQLAREYNPAVTSLLAGAAEQLRDVAELISAQVQRAAERFVEPDDDGFTLPLRAVRQMPRAVRTELLRNLITERFGRTLTTKQVRSLERFLLDPDRPQPPLARGLVCDIVFDRLIVRRSRPEPQHQPVEIAVPGVTVHPTLNVEAAARFSPRPPDWKPRNGSNVPLAELWRRVEAGEDLDLTQDFDADRLLGRDCLRAPDTPPAERPLVLRTRRPGDHMQPIGFDGVKKVQNILVDEKLPAAVRAKLPLLCRGDAVVWVPGYRIADPYKVTDETRRLLVVRLMSQHRPGRQHDGAQAETR